MSVPSSVPSGSSILGSLRKYLRDTLGKLGMRDLDAFIDRYEVGGNAIASGRIIKADPDQTDIRIQLVDASGRIMDCPGIVIEPWMRMRRDHGLPGTLVEKKTALEFPMLHAIDLVVVPRKTLEHAIEQEKMRVVCDKIVRAPDNAIICIWRDVLPVKLRTDVDLDRSFDWSAAKLALYGFNTFNIQYCVSDGTMIMDQRERGIEGTTVAIKRFTEVVDRLAAGKIHGPKDQFAVDMIKRCATKFDLQEPFRSDWVRDGMRAMGCELIGARDLFSRDECSQAMMRTCFTNFVYYAPEKPIVLLGENILSPNYIVIKS